MRKILFSITLLLGCAAGHVSAQVGKDSVLLFAYFKNNGQDGLHLAYSEDGYQFKALNNDSSFLKPMVGRDKLMRDPCVILGADNRFHMVWTVSWKERGIGYASSADMIHWSEQQYLPVMEHEPTAINSWAPEVTYDSKKKNYIIYWSTTIPGRFKKTDSTAESNYNHRIYTTTTKDFKTFSKTKLYYDQDFNVIDATIVPDGNRYLMFLKDETKFPTPQKNLHVAYGTTIEKGFGKPSRSITGDYWAEGPTAIKLGNAWMVYFDKYRNHKYGAVTSTDLEHWTDVSDKIQFPSGTRHGTVVKVPVSVLKTLQQYQP